jgi:hypothetical protein
MRRLTISVPLAALLALLAGAAYAAVPPAPSGGKLEFRVLLNEETKPLALAAIAEPETRARVSDIADYILGQVGAVSVWRYLIEADETPQAADLVAPYGHWADIHGLRDVGFYRLRRDRGARGDDRPDALARLYYSGGHDGALLAVMADQDTVTIAWAEGQISLGPLAAAWLGLSGEQAAQPEAPSVEAAMPALPPDLPDDLLDIRLNLSAEELGPLARDIAARLEADPGAVTADLAAMLRKGARVVAPVRGLTALVYSTPDAASVERVVGPAKLYAQTKGWAGLFQYGEGDQAAELYAKMGDDGGALVVGRRGDRSVLLLTEGCPDLMALLAP